MSSPPLARWTLPLAAVLAFGGCASRPTTLYEWGGYDELLYQSYKSPQRVESMRVGLETLVARLEQQRQRVPPGLYAELGTLYFEMGDGRKAVANYELERRNWPESKTLMDALIATLERRAGGSTAPGATK
jgi:hypothetical protein